MLANVAKVLALVACAQAQVTPYRPRDGWDAKTLENGAVVSTTPVSSLWETPILNGDGSRGPFGQRTRTGDGLTDSTLLTGVRKRNSLYATRMTTSAQELYATRMTSSPKRKAPKPSLVLKEKIELCPGGGIVSRNLGVCCPASCGSCGGKGCGERPGGASQCCSGVIQSNNEVCAFEGSAASDSLDDSNDDADSFDANAVAAAASSSRFPCIIAKSRATSATIIPQTTTTTATATTATTATATGASFSPYTASSAAFYQQSAYSPYTTNNNKNNNNNYNNNNAFNSYGTNNFYAPRPYSPYQG